MGRKKKLNPEELSPLEREVMAVLWKLGEATAGQVLEKLAGEKEFAYTTISTVLRVLEQKGVVEARTEGRGHIYVPVLSQPKYQKQALKDFLGGVFDGTPSNLVSRLLDLESVDRKELEEIRSLLNQRLKK